MNKKMIIKFDQNGQILAIVKSDEMSEEGMPIGEEEAGIEVIELDEKSKYFKMEPLDVHNAYEIDVKKKSLKKKTAKKKT